MDAVLPHRRAGEVLAGARGQDHRVAQAAGGDGARRPSPRSRGLWGGGLMQPNLAVSIPSFDRAAIESHVSMLHERAAGVDGVLVVSVFNEGKPGVVTHHNVGDICSMVDAITAQDGVPGANVYTGLHVMRRGLPRGARGLEKDIAAVLGLVADMDADTGRAGTTPADPSYVVESSPGNFQPVWLFDSPIAPADAKPVAAALKAATGADHGTADITHVWRIPGTLNWPSRKKLERGRSPEPTLATVSAPWTGALYTPTALSSAMPAVPAVRAQAVARLDELPDASVIAIDPETRALLEADGQPDRSAHAGRVVEHLAFRGHSAEQAIALVLACKGAWTERYKSEAAIRRDFERLWSKFAPKHDTSAIHVSKLIANAANKNSLIAPPARATRINASVLINKVYPPIAYCVPGLVTEGLTILAGRPKLGKSWMALDFAMAVATGGRALGSIECERGDALYMALEDNERRLQDRLKVWLPKLVARPDLSGLELQTEAPRIDAGLLQAIDTWRISVENPRLVIIDTLAMVKPAKKPSQDSYSADYAALSPLQKYASEHRLAVLVVTHVRKAEAIDPLEAVSGTNGLTGTADTTLVLDRDADGPKLYGRGRDIEEVEKALRFDTGKWSVLGNVDDVRNSDTRRKILAAMEAHSRPMSQKEIAEATDLKSGTVNARLRNLVEAGKVQKTSYGSYVLVQP